MRIDAKKVVTWLAIVALGIFIFNSASALLGKDKDTDVDTEGVVAVQAI